MSRGFYFLYTDLNSDITGKDDSMGIKKLFGIYFGGYSEDISGNFVSSFKEHSKLCDEKDGTKGRK